jgi:hypothetical protein
MQKRRIYWPHGNPQFTAWEISSNVGRVVVRRNHTLGRREGQSCQGWDVWVGDQYLGAVGSRTLTELVTLSHSGLKSLALPACCGRHADFSSGPLATPKRSPKSGWGGRRPMAGRPRKAAARRVDLATTVDRRTLELIDRHRGETSRGEFLDRLVQEAKLR